MYLITAAASVVASILFMLGLQAGVDAFYPRGDANTFGAQIQVTAVPLVRAAVVKPVAAPAPAPVAASASREIEKPDTSLSVLLARADADAGQETAKSCAVCHTWNKGGGNRVGPNLWGVLGRDIAKDPGFSYSPALQQKGGRWSYNDLYRWIGEPNELAPGNNMYKMGFAGVKDPQQRANLIAFLAKQSDNPVSLTWSRW
jgi:cytochrome c